MPKPAPVESLLRAGRRTRAPVASALALVGIALLALEMGPARAQVKLLPTEEAFRFAARALDVRTVEASFAVADGYYLYRDKLRFSATSPAVTVGAVELPAGKVKEDPFFGKVETYRDRVVVRLPLENAVAGQAVTLRADSQGCADVGVCYPANTQSVTVNVPQAGAPPGPLIDANPPRKRWFN
jgi:thiol:disulfide interchange protein DsbD